jgi:hypothetical protein
VTAKNAATSGGFNSTSVQKDFNTFWLSMTQEFNRMLIKTDTMNGSERKALLRDVQQTILKTVNCVGQRPEDPQQPAREHGSCV